MARSTLSIKRRALAAVAGGASLAIVLTACSGSGDGGDAGDTEAATADCSAYEEYGDLSGKTVSVYTTIVDTEAEQQQESYKPFEDCTGATIKYEGSKEFEAQLPIRIQSGSAPDIAYIPQPGFLKSLVQDYPDAILPVGDAASANVDEFYTESWRDYGTVDGTLYATPLGANVKSFVWYSPAMFEDAGYEIPTTWDELIALSDQIVEDNPDGEIKPWCAGIGSGEATGWPATDWMEDVVLRTAGPDVYDQWVNHEIPFNDPQIADALATVGTVLKNDEYVNGGIGDVFAFYFPGNDTEAKPVLGGGEFVVSFADRPEVQAFQAFLTSPEWSNAKATATPQGWISANKELDKSLLQSPIDQLSYGLLTDDSYVFRFDGSDMMPAAVGAGSFWTEMTEWIASDKSDTAVLDAIEASWPTS